MPISKIDVSGFTFPSTAVTYPSVAVTNSLTVDGVLGNSAGTTATSMRFVSSSITPTTNSIQGIYSLALVRNFNGASGAVYYHIVLPARYNSNNSKMFMLEIKGYDFDGGRVINMMIGGYVTPVSNGGPVSRIAVWDAASYYSPTVYYSSTYNVGVARFYMASKYYNTFVVNAICVGNGDVIYPGELTIVESTNATI